MSDLDEVIEDSLNDAIEPEPTEDPVEESVDTEEPSTEPVAEDPAAAEPAEEPAAEEKPAKTAEDFDKKYGLQAQGVGGKENRIPHSRVQQLVKKAVADTRVETEKSFAPKLAEFETKVRDYETRFQQVQQFEQILDQQPQEFLRRLASHPAYKPFFEYIEGLATGQAKTQTEAQPTSAELSEMPMPDKQLPDGTMIFSEEQAAKYSQWQEQVISAKVEARVAKQLEDKISKRYEPMVRDYETQQRIAQTLPVIRQQIAEARTWPLFTDNEAEITKALAANPSLTLERAYQQVVFPIIQQSRDDMRKSILAEIKQRPATTASPTARTKTAPTKSSGPRDLDDIIAEQVAKIQS